jgi:predicted AlkP superfamily phosphohydrolase/phosphomutase
VRRTVVIGLDGASWDILGPFLEAGTMPSLAALLDRAAAGSLTSTFPPYTPPAWTSAVTGVNPGRHGIFGFVRGASDAPELVHWGLVRAPALWDYVDGASVGLFHLPVTFPPPTVPGWCVGAVWLPTGREIHGYTYPVHLEDRIRAVSPGYAPVIGVDIRRDWRGTDLALAVRDTMAERRAVLSRLLDEWPTDVVFAVLEAPDRLQHVYYRYLSPREPESTTRRAASVRRAVAEALRELDAVVGLLDAYAGPDGVAIVCSDHGFTSWDGYLNGNVLLERAGLMSVRGMGRALRSPAAIRLASLAARALPRRTAIRLRRRTGSLVDWNETVAYANRLGSQGFSVNLAGREPAGVVPADDYEAAREELRSLLADVRTPAGGSFAAAIRDRQELYRGPEVGQAPDLLVEPEGWHWEISDQVAVRDLFTDFSGLPLGCHHPEGVIAIRAPGGRRTELSARIEDVLPTILYAAGLPVPAGLDGTARTEAFGDGWPAVVTAPASDREDAPEASSPYTEEEEEQIVQYLTDLGYLG